MRLSRDIVLLMLFGPFLVSLSQAQNLNIYLLYDAVVESDLNNDGFIDASEVHNIDDVMMNRLVINSFYAEDYRYELLEIASHIGYDFNVGISSSDYNVVFENGTIEFPYGNLSIFQGEPSDTVYVKRGASNSTFTVEVFSGIQKVNSDKPYYGFFMADVDSMINVEKLWGENSSLKYVEFSPYAQNGVDFNLDGVSGIESIDLSSYSSIGSCEISGSTSLKTVCVFDGNESQVNDNTGLVEISSSCGDNIITNINQSVLNTLLAGGYDVNSDNYISFSEILLIDSLSLNNANIDSLNGIHLAENLVYLDVSNNNLDTIALANFPNLEYLNVSGNNITALDFSGVLVNGASTEELQTLSTGYGLDSLIVSDNDLTELDVSELSISYLAADNNPSLQTICVSQPQLDNQVQDWTKDPSATFSAGCSVITSSGNVGLVQNELYPNPATTFLQFTSGLSTIVSLEGKVVYQNTAQQTSVNVSNWSKGLYFAKFYNGENIKVIIR